MTPENRKDLFELLNGIGEVYRQPPLSETAIMIYYNALEGYTIEQIRIAVSAHTKDPEHGRFYPKIADIVRNIEGGTITHDHVLASARQKNTPFGVLCLIQIGHHDLQNQTDMFYLKQRAQECVDKAPEWRRRGAQGDYSDHELSIMMKYGVNPLQGFDVDLPPPPNRELLIQRAKKVKESNRHNFLIEPPREPEENEKTAGMPDSVREFLANVANSDSKRA